jgi:hypothetical protein
MIKRLALIALVMLAGNIQRSAAQDKIPQPDQAITAEDNVKTGFTIHDPDGSKGLIVSVETWQNQDIRVVLTFRKRADGSTDSALWDYVQADRKSKKPLFLHDNVKFTKLFRMSPQSYRERLRPSMQIVFLFRKGEPVPFGAKVDFDRFPVNAALPVSSARHFLQELVGHRFFGGKTDQRRMATAIANRIARSQTAMNDSKAVLGTTATAH